MSIFNESATISFLNEGLFGRKKNHSKASKKHGNLTKEEISSCTSILKSVASSMPIVKDAINFKVSDTYEDYLRYNFDYITVADIDEEEDIFSEDDYGTKCSDARKKAGYPEDFNKFVSAYKDSLKKTKDEVNKKIKEKFDGIELDIDESEVTKFNIVSKKPKED